MVFFSSFTRAGGPDFERTERHSFDFSGAKLVLDLPGNLDQDFPRGNKIDRINLYKNNYNEANYYNSVLLERYWGYRGDFWRNFGQRFAILEFRLNLARANKDSNLLENILELEELENLPPGNYQKENLGITPVLKVYASLENGQPQDISQSKKVDYYIAIEEQYFIVLSFTYLKSSGGDYMPAGWQEKIESDIKRIVDSVELEYAPSVQARLETMVVQ